jgi:hypothetical protein
MAPETLTIPHPTKKSPTVYIMPFTRMPTFLIGCAGAILWHQGGDRFVAFMNRGRVQVKAWATIASGLVVLGLVEYGPQRELGYAPGKW